MTAKQTTLDEMGPANRIKRRSLLQGMGGVAAAVLGAGVAAADTVQPALTKTVTAPPADATQQAGYRLTEHIRAYYRTTRL